MVSVIMKKNFVRVKLMVGCARKQVNAGRSALESPSATRDFPASIPLHPGRK
jgi:hypothetical protein